MKPYFSYFVFHLSNKTPTLWHDNCQASLGLVFWHPPFDLNIWSVYLHFKQSWL